MYTAQEGLRQVPGRPPYSPPQARTAWIAATERALPWPLAAGISARRQASSQATSPRSRGLTNVRAATLAGCGDAGAATWQSTPDALAPFYLDTARLADLYDATIATHPSLGSRSHGALHSLQRVAQSQQRQQGNSANPPSGGAPQVADYGDPVQRIESLRSFLKNQHRS